MSYSEPAGAKARRTRLAILTALAVAVVAALIGVLGCQSLAVSSSAVSSSAATSTSAPSTSATSTNAAYPGTQPPHRPQKSLPADGHAVLGEADGVVRGGVTVFDGVPVVARLDPGLLRELRRAAADAARDGVEFFVNSGWRSPKYQEQLLDEAVSKYGSRAQAARWVATPTTSAHVTGNAVDIGHADASAWLSKYGTRYGLCQIYGNEPWHYELRPEAIGHGCPSMYANPTRDPRMKH